MTANGWNRRNPVICRGSVAQKRKLRHYRSYPIIDKLMKLR
jgi:hypothetical protein